MDNFQVRNSPGLRKFLQDEPSGARNAIIEWQEFAKDNREVTSFTTAEQWFTWADAHPGTDRYLWVGKELEVVSRDPHPQETRPATSGPSKEIELPGFAKVGFFLGGFAETVQKPQILEHDWDYIRVEYEKQNEWLKKNNQKDFLSKDGLDYLYGSIDDTKTKSLNQETREELQRIAQGKKKIADKLALYDNKKNETYADMQYDPSVQIVNKQVKDHLQGRFDLFMKNNPRATKEEQEKKYKELSLAIENKHWEEFIAAHPEKAAQYLKDGHSQNNAHLKQAIKSIDDKRKAIEAAEQEKLQKEKEEKEKKLQEEKRKWAQKQPKEGAHVIEDIMDMYQERYPQNGLVDISDQDEKDQTSAPQISKRNMYRVMKELSNIDIPETPEMPEIPEGPGPSSPQPSPQTPQAPSRPSGSSMRNLSRMGRGLGNAAKGLGNAGKGAAQAARAAASAGRLAVIFGNPVTWIIIVGLLIIIIVVLIVFGGEPEQQTPRTPTMPGGTGGSIAHCQFYRGAAAPAQYKSPILMGYFDEASRLSGIPASVLAGVARVESPGLVNFTDENLSTFSCAESPTGALGLMQIQPRGTTGHDSTAVTKGASYIGIPYDNLKREDYCDLRKSIFMGAGFINQKRIYVTGREWDPARTNDKTYIDGVAASYYGCLKYPTCEDNDGTGGGPYSYGDDVYNSVSNCTPAATTTAPPVGTTTTPSTKLQEILQWTQRINDQLQTGLPSTSFNKMLADITNGIYTATKRQALDRGVGLSGIYWCTNIVIDSYNLSGIGGLGPNQQGVRSMMEFWQNTPGYRYIPNNGADSITQVQPGFALFRRHPDNYIYDHVSIVKSISIDERGNGHIETLDSNSFKGWTSSIVEGQFTDRAFLAPIVGFGGLQ